MPAATVDPPSSVTAYADRQTVRLPGGELLRVADAIRRLPWVPMLCPTMPHQYVVSGWRDVRPTDLDAIRTMIRESSDTRLAYWRGYQSPTRYWHGPARAIAQSFGTTDGIWVPTGGGLAS